MIESARVIVWLEIEKFIRKESDNPIWSIPAIANVAQQSQSCDRWEICGSLLRWKENRVLNAWANVVDCKAEKIALLKNVFNLIYDANSCFNATFHFDLLTVIRVAHWNARRCHCWSTFRKSHFPPKGDIEIAQITSQRPRELRIYNFSCGACALRCILISPRLIDFHHENFSEAVTEICRVSSWLEK